MPASRAIIFSAAVALTHLAARLRRQTSASADRQSQFRETIAPFVTQFCGDCHSGSKAEKGLRLTDFQSAQSLVDNRTHLEKSASKNCALAPCRQRTPAAVHRTVRCHRSASRRSSGRSRPKIAPHDPGHVTIRRLNRAEYNNTIRDLLGIDFHPADDFPADDVGYGFDNNGDVLSLPPLLLEKYLAAAEKAVSLALEHDPAKPRRDHTVAS